MIALLYARSDLLSDACDCEEGRHDRPRGEDGSFAEPWVIECPAFHAKHKGDPLYGATIDKIPETPDEQQARETRDKQGIKERDQTMATALQRLAAMPELLERLIGNQVPPVPQVPQVPGPSATCPGGHQNPVSARFCSECGAPAGSQAPEPPRAARKPLKDWRLDDLRALAQTKGLDDSGTRTDLIARIRAARAAA